MPTPKQLKQKKMAEIRKKRRKERPLTFKQKRFIQEYLKTGNAKASVEAVYDANPQTANQMGHQLTHNPKIKKKIDEALEKMNLDEDFAVKALKEIISSGQKNATEEAKPGDALRGLEMFFKMKGYLGNQKQTLKLNFKQKAEGMDVTQIKKELKKLDETQKQLLDMMKGEVEDAEYEETVSD